MGVGKDFFEVDKAYFDDFIPLFNQIEKIFDENGTR